MKGTNIKKSADNSFRLDHNAKENAFDTEYSNNCDNPKSVCDFLRTIDPAMRAEIAESVKAAKYEIYRINPIFSKQF